MLLFPCFGGGFNKKSDMLYKTLTCETQNFR